MSRVETEAPKAASEEEDMKESRKCNKSFRHHGKMHNKHFKHCCMRKNIPWYFKHKINDAEEAFPLHTCNHKCCRTAEEAGPFRDRRRMRMRMRRRIWRMKRRMIRHMYRQYAYRMMYLQRMNQMQNPYYHQRTPYGSQFYPMNWQPQPPFFNQQQNPKQWRMRPHDCHDHHHCGMKGRMNQEPYSMYGYGYQGYGRPAARFMYPPPYGYPYYGNCYGNGHGSGFQCYPIHPRRWMRPAQVW